MYFEFVNNFTGEAEIKEISHVSLRKVQDGWAIIDKQLKEKSEFADSFVTLLSQMQLGKDETEFRTGHYTKDKSQWVDELSGLYADSCEIAFFDSKSQAIMVFNAIRAAIKSGKNYFDLTQFQEATL